ncbi:sigma 54-interacting transcriptional regulator [Azotobacter beijerinckii]|uniref:sigma 54-interacting transcriptional regulator n=1 Tax=Azotobacter beijerinckii TaxID=170623 RepID=UPI0037BE3CDC
MQLGATLRLRGETGTGTGTGKELLAQDIHNLSPRAQGPFVALKSPTAWWRPNCSAAYTGAVCKARIGQFELAEAALELRALQPWPGSVQELDNLLERTRRPPHPPAGAQPGQCRTCQPVQQATAARTRQTLNSRAVRQDGPPVTPENGTCLADRPPPTDENRQPPAQSAHFADNCRHRPAGTDLATDRTGPAQGRHDLA